MTWFPTDYLVFLLVWLEGHHTWNSDFFSAYCLVKICSQVLVHIQWHVQCTSTYVYGCAGLNLECKYHKKAMCIIGQTSNLSFLISAFMFFLHRVYDSEKYRLVQTNLGHTDSVRDIIHIPERNQYVSTSWDKTIRIWNEWKQIKKKVTVCINKISS